jgi:hypothetical protein
MPCPNRKEENKDMIPSVLSANEDEDNREDNLSGAA